MNTSEHWNKVWSNPQTRDWREDAMAPIYDRILELAPRGKPIVDLGGGVGHFARRAQEKGFDVTVYDLSATAIEAARAAGLAAYVVDLENELPFIADGGTVVATEVLEHLSEAALGRLFDACVGHVCFLSVPNDRLTPSEEPEHLRSWTAIGLLRDLRFQFAPPSEITDGGAKVWRSSSVFPVRVEVIGKPAMLNPARFPSDRGQRSHLLGVVGLEKKVGVSLTMPVRDEAADLEECLASFRGFVDEIVIGVDPRTVDATREIAAKYADKVFDLTPEQLRGPADKPEEWVPEAGIHFANARNVCIDACSHEWVFMTEGHEKLWKGGDVLLHLDQLPAACRVVGVTRTAGPPLMRQQWVFPWLAKRASDIRYERSTHNTLAFPEGTLVITAPQVKTLHERVHAKDLERQKQRKVQNRVKLLDDWLRRGSEHSLHYLGAEWREWAPEKAIERFREFLATGRHGALRYQTRLVLAKELGYLGRDDEAIEVLHGAEADDWTRKEHWVFLGDLWMERGEIERALTFYEYAAVNYGKLPVTTWFLDVALYTWMLAQRLADAYAQLGRLEEAERWAQAVVDHFIAEDAHGALLDEARTNLSTIQEARHHHGYEHAAAQ